MADKVECRSDHAYPGYPIVFYWQGLRLLVDEIVAESETPRGHSFRVHNLVYGIFILNYESFTDQWSVEQI